MSYQGPGALVEVTGKDGKNIFDGRNVTGFSNEEEEQAGLTDQVPFLLETQMKKVGGKYNKAAQAWGECLQVDGNVITGQVSQPLSGYQPFLCSRLMSSCDCLEPSFSGGCWQSNCRVLEQALDCYRRIQTEVKLVTSGKCEITS